MDTPKIDARNIKRRLAAVAFADVAGFSKLMELDDTQTILRWKALRANLLEPKIAEHDGHLLQVMGDGLFIEFESVVSAVRWAHDVQRAIAQSLDEHEGDALLMRIGINVEDVIVDGDKRHGDGVNIAARIQQLAGPGEVVMTATVRDHVWNKLGVELTDLGERELKNISRPVRIYRLEHGSQSGVRRRFAQPHLSWNNRPSIAVMPFKNLGGDPKEAYFGEGITEEIIGALAHNRSLLVIARHSTLPYRDRQADVRQIASELSVRYVLDGSVRRQLEKLRISVDLIDAGQNRTIWAEKYDGGVAELFEFQDRISASVVAMIEPRVYEAEAERVRSKPTDSLDAYDCVLRAYPLFYTSDEREFMTAGVLLDHAIELDPAYAQAWAHKAWWYILLIGEWRARATERDFTMAQVTAQKGLKLDPMDAFALAVAAHAESFLGNRPESAIEMFERALQLNKNSAFAWAISGITCCYLGQPEDALDRLRNSWRLSPFDPLKFFFWGVAGFAEFIAGRYEEALVWLLKARRDHPGHLAAHRNLAACFAQLGRMDEARAAAADLLAREPTFRISVFESRYPLRRPGDRERLLSGLRAAGLPE
jgi:TolB-like protein/class 3 adenylate cyclase/Tfp pilus assembly protein PilF